IIKAEEKKILAQQQFSEVSQLINNEIETPIQAQLDATKKELLLLKSTYTDNHIEVRKLNAKIKQLEDQVISSRKEIQDKISEDTEGSIAQSVNEQLTGINNEIERLIKEESKINQQIAIYEKRLEEIPHVELQLSALSRDYDNTKTFYERLLNKKLEAEQAENLERRQQGEQFKILDPASLPKLPFKPNPKKVFPVGFLLGLCIGCGLVFLVEILDKSFKNEKDAEDYLGVPVLAVIPLVKREKGSHLIVHS
ncbi:MAG: GumC family protein, partial [bacterium]